MRQLVDNFGRKIDYLRISITDRCNYRCIYCQPEEQFKFIPHEEILRYEEIVEIVQEAVNLGLTKIRITGGEPLLRKGVIDFIRELREIKKLEDLSLSTNGLFLAEYAKKLKEAGLDRVNISLDSLQKEKYREITRGGDLEKVLRGIDSACKEGLLPLKINTVVMKGINDEEIEDFVELARRKPVEVRFIELMPSNEQVGVNYKERFISAGEIKKRLEKKYCLEPLKLNSPQGNGPAKSYELEGGRGTLGFITAISQHFCQSCNRIRLTSKGKLRPCLFSNQEIELKKTLRALKGVEDNQNLRRKIIREAMETAVKIKPEGHELKEGALNSTAFKMSQIGG